VNFFPPLDNGRGGSGPKSALGTLFRSHKEQTCSDFKCLAEDPVLLRSALLLFGSDCSWVNRGGDYRVGGGQGREVLGEFLCEVDADLSVVLKREKEERVRTRKALIGCRAVLLPNPHSSPRHSRT
jgi:hypothetical protein